MKRLFVVLLACMVCSICSHAQTPPNDPYTNKTDKRTMQLNSTYTLDPKGSLGIQDQHITSSSTSLSGDVSAFEITRGDKITPFSAPENGYYYKFKVKPLQEGTFTLTASCGYLIKGAGTQLHSKKVITYTITVVQVKSISIPSTKTLKVGATYTFSPTVTPSSAITTFTWSSSNKNVVTVNSSGKITAKAVGTATITCKAENGVKATCKVTVTPIMVSSITLNNTSLSLNTGDTHQLTATVAPSNAANKNVTWKSSNTSVATVSTSGLVTALTPGSSTITATAADGSNVSASCVLTVQSSIATAIDKVEQGDPETPPTAYNLNGQRVSSRTNHKGIYIVNGRKVVH